MCGYVEKFRAQIFPPQVISYVYVKRIYEFGKTTKLWKTFYLNTNVGTATVFVTYPIDFLKIPTNPQTNLS